MLKKLKNECENFEKSNSEVVEKQQLSLAYYILFINSRYCRNLIHRQIVITRLIFYLKDKSIRVRAFG